MENELRENIVKQSLPQEETTKKEWVRPHFKVLRVDSGVGGAGDGFAYDILS